MEIIIVIGIGLIFSTVIAVWVTSIQSGEIDKCTELRIAHAKLLTGELKIEDISNELLLRLRLPKFTHVGVGGVGPFYRPSFEIYSMVGDELQRRRNSKKSTFDEMAPKLAAFLSDNPPALPRPYIKLGK